jgi:APA family basic amino acid/polyamine antiporter
MHDTTSVVSLTSVQNAAPSLRRELGRWDLTAIGVNQVIGAAVFAQPALLAARAGAWSPWLVAAVGLAVMLIALSFAEVGSRFEGTGGSYLYTRSAFGRFAAFEVGWMLWFTRVTSWAAVISVLVTYLGYYWPAMTTGWPRAAVITLVIVIITVINVRGIRVSSLFVNVLTIGKLLPLAVFIIAGLAAVDPARLAIQGPLPPADIASTALLLIYGFGGFEVVPVVAGETKNPTRAVPFALIMTLALVSLILTLVQAVALGTLPTLATSSTPLTDAASVFLGAGGAVMMTLGTIVSVTGNNLGGALSGSRNLFALAEQRDLPAFFGRIHPRFRTPVTAILVTGGVALVLALSGRYAALAAVSAISRLTVYAFTCAATLRLRQPRFAARVRPASFVVPLGPVIPSLGIVMAVAIIAGATPAQLRAGVYALVAGAVLYLIALRRPGPLRASEARTENE